jgi:hypothetical protein
MFLLPFGIAQELFTSFSRRDLIAAHQARQGHQTNAKLRTDVSTWAGFILAARLTT